MMQEAGGIYGPKTFCRWTILSANFAFVLTPETLDKIMLFLLLSFLNKMSKMKKGKYESNDASQFVAGTDIG